MATWQHVFRVVQLESRAPVALDLSCAMFTRLDSLLERRASWTGDIIQWGHLESTAFEVVTDQGAIVDMLFRLDVRREWKSLVRDTWEICAANGLVFLTVPDGRSISSLAEAIEETESSPAAAFARDPHAYLKGLAVDPAE